MREAGVNAVFVAADRGRGRGGQRRFDRRDERDPIRVNALITGNVDTPLYRELLGVGPEVDRGSLSAPNPTGRVAGPEEVAAFVAFLLSDEARFVTGPAEVAVT